MFNLLKKKLKDFFSGTPKVSIEERKEETKILPDLTESEMIDVKKEVGASIDLIEAESTDSFKTYKQESLVEKEEHLENAIKTEERGEPHNLFSKLKKVFTTKKISESEFEILFDKLELILIENNVAVEVINFFRENLKKKLLNREIERHTLKMVIETSLKEAMAELFVENFDLIEKIKERIHERKPYIIVFFGINGSGKTTTIAKIAHLLIKNNFSCVLAAADTFRAASIEQLENHAKKLNCDIIKHQYGADPAAVAFDAISYARSHSKDVVLIDTAGRIHTKADLLREMEKIVRVTKPDLKIFVAEAIAGNDALEQARKFNEAVGIDASILTKADVDEKGGATLSISYVTKKPLLFLGVGQEYDKLKFFNKEEIINNLFY